MKKMINRKILILISLLLFLPLLVGCFLFPSANQSPTITSTPITTATVGEEYTYDVEATDPDSGDTLTYSLTTSPTGMNINSITGVINWASTSAQIGDHNVTVEVSDGSLSDTQSFIIVVSEAPPAYPAPPAPTPTPTPTYTVTYDGNGSTGGTVPSDANNYEQGDSVTVLGNTGNLEKTQDGISSLLFTGWNTAADGSGTSYNAADTFNMGNANVTLFAQWSVIRGTGPAGGLIFYDKGSVSDGWRYLEAAPSDQSISQAWSNITDVAVGTSAQGIEIGTGQANTIAIIAQLGHTESAAKLCDDLSIVNNLITYNDWFLPSQDELNLMYENLKIAGVGGFADDYYWGSSEYDAGIARAQYFGNGFQGNSYKGSTTLRVRAIRAFRSTEPTYLVNYNANGATGGTVPSDGYHYEPGDTVTVLDNTGNLVKTGYTFAGWNTKADGSGTDQAEGSTFTMGASNVTLYAKWTPPETYSIGDVGPAGGLIFYDKGSYSDGWRYLEAAPASTEWTIKQWGSDGTLIGETETGIGTGKNNTTTIVTWLNNHSETGKAAQICDALTEAGYSDWFLPSKGELNLMYTNLHIEGVGGFAANDGGGYCYWSSSEYDAYYAWYQAFNNGSQSYYSKIYCTYRVRAVRAF